MLKQQQSSGAAGGGFTGKLTLSDEDRDILDKLMNDDSDKGTNNYKI
jgi:hypothetical protein